jgi:hypothetical protein
MLFPIVLALMSNKDCQTIEQRAVCAAVIQGETKAETPFPDLPDACIAKTGRVRPAADEARVITLKRWDVVADIRDRQSADCAAWGADQKRLRGNSGL